MCITLLASVHYITCFRVFQCKVIDGRPKGRYDGTSPEPNPSLNSGHILGTINVPFLTAIDPDSKTMKDKDGLQQGMLTLTCVYGFKAFGTCTTIIEVFVHNY